MKETKMLGGLAILVGTIGCANPQVPSQVKQDAIHSSCVNIVALAGNANANCSSLTPQQQKLIESIPAILAKIISECLDGDAVMKKLDEILHAVNPNAPSQGIFL